MIGSSKKTLSRESLDTLQVNLGRVCNLSCWHCHHESGPRRHEAMTEEIAERVAESLRKLGVGRLELTGGSPELNTNFDFLVERARAMGLTVAVRTNLVVIFEPDCEFLPNFYRSNGVEIIGSLPCYMEENVDRQRGRGTFKKSIEALAILNELGYGEPGSGLVLNLVYNPGHAVLAADQATLENAYRKNLARYGVRFNALFAITNMPIGRFRSGLIASDRLEEYTTLLRSSSNPGNWEAVMCRRMATVGWDGAVYDCDFNLALKLHTIGGPLKIWDIEAGGLAGKAIRTGEHCLGCVAGRGSGCFGALAPTLCVEG